MIHPEVGLGVDEVNTGRGGGARQVVTTCQRDGQGLGHGVCRWLIGGDAGDGDGDVVAAGEAAGDAGAGVNIVGARVGDAAGVGGDIHGGLEGLRAVLAEGEGDVPGPVIGSLETDNVHSGTGAGQVNRDGSGSPGLGVKEVAVLHHICQAFSYGIGGAEQGDGDAFMRHGGRQGMGHGDTVVSGGEVGFMMSAGSANTDCVTHRQGSCVVIGKAGQGEVEGPAGQDAAGEVGSINADPWQAKPRDFPGRDGEGHLDRTHRVGQGEVAGQVTSAKR